MAPSIFSYYGQDTSGGGVTPPPDNSGDSGDNSGWLSGLGDLFSGIGNAVATGIKASNTPQPVLFPPRTSTGLLPTATGSGLNGLLSSPLTLILIAVGAILLLRRK